MKLRFTRAKQSRKVLFPIAGRDDLTKATRAYGRILTANSSWSLT